MSIAPQSDAEFFFNRESADHSALNSQRSLDFTPRYSAVQKRGMQ